MDNLILNQMLSDHAKWLEDPSKGKRAAFKDENLTGLFLPEANLEGTVFVNCNLSRADFDGANLRFCIFVDCDVTGAHIDLLGDSTIVNEGNYTREY